MCRHLVWLGRPRSLASLLLDPPWSLRRQAYQPRRQDRGLVNADGFGVAWYDPAVRAAPARYRRSVPIWTDASLASFAPVVRSGSMLAALRSTTIGMPVDERSAAPFVADRWCFSLNGTATLESLRPLLGGGAGAGSAVEPTCDAVVLAEVVLAALLAGQDPVGVLDAVVTEVSARDPQARLNMLITDGERAFGTAWGASLCALHEGGLAAGGVLVASEPLDDDPRWTDVPDGSVVAATASGLHCRPLSALGASRRR